MRRQEEFFVPTVLPGQFYTLYTQDYDNVLIRPINTTSGTITIGVNLAGFESIVVNAYPMGTTPLFMFSRYSAGGLIAQPAAGAVATILPLGMSLSVQFLGAGGQLVVSCSAQV